MGLYILSIFGVSLYITIQLWYGRNYREQQFKVIQAFGCPNKSYNKHTHKLTNNLKTRVQYF